MIQKDADSVHWDLVDSSGNIGRKVVANSTNTASTFAVTTTDATGNPINTGYQCSAVTTITNVPLTGQTSPVTKRSVTLTYAATGFTTQLVWYAAPVANSSSVTTPLVQLTGATGGITVFTSQ